MHIYFKPFCLKSLRVRLCCFPARLMAMATVAEAWTRTVAGAPVKDFFLVLMFLFVVVAAPLASTCHARFPTFELFVPLFQHAVVLLKVLVTRGGQHALALRQPRPVCG